MKEAAAKVRRGLSALNMAMRRDPAFRAAWDAAHGQYIDARCGVMEQGLYDIGVPHDEELWREEEPDGKGGMRLIKRRMKKGSLNVTAALAFLRAHRVEYREGAQSLSSETLADAVRKVKAESAKPKP